MEALPNEIIFVSGQRGSGKSYWTKTMSLSLPRCIIWDSLGEYQADKRIFDLDELADFLIQDESNPRLFRVAYDSCQPEVDFPYFCRLVLARQNLYVIIEELDLLATPYTCPIEFAKLIKYGRHYGIQIIGVSRRPAEVSRLFTSQATRFITFPQHEPNDIKYFTSIFGKDALKLNSMPSYHFLDVNFSGQIDYSIRPPI